MSSTRPRLLFLRGCDERTLHYFCVSSVEPLLGWLSCHFDTTVVDEECVRPADLIARFNPELVLMLSTEGGLLTNLGLDRPGTNPFGSVPLAALTLMDADSPAKIQLFADMEKFGVEVLFAMDNTFVDLAPGWEKQIVFCPWFLNRTHEPDPCGEKVYPIGLFGQGFEEQADMLNYPWRLRLAKLLRRRYPVLSVPTPNPIHAPHDIVGEKYARWLNRTKIALSCGGRRHVFVKKMLEIPASMTCLATEDIPVLHVLGYRDMENCVFLDDTNYAEKLDALLGDDDLLARITRAGYEHVAANHTPEKRDVLLRWFEARREGHGFGSSESAGLEMTPFANAVREAIEVLMAGGDIEQARATLEAESHAYPRAHEPRFGLALYHLRQGDPQAAIDVLAKGFRISMKVGVRQPDPALWGLYILAHLALGAEASARFLCELFPELRHPFMTSVRVRLGVAEPDIDVSGAKTIVPAPPEFSELEYEDLAGNLIQLNRRC